MRRSGSSSCLLRPRSSLSLSELSESEPPTVTVFNTKRLPTYSTERYYMLSELEMNAHSVQFLCDFLEDHDDKNNLCQDAIHSKTDDVKNNVSTVQSQIVLPPCVLLYLLWRPGEIASPHAFMEGPITDAVRRIQNMIHCRDTNSSSNPASPPQLPPSLSSPPSSPVRKSSWSMSPSSRNDSFIDNNDEIAIYVVVDRLSPEPPHVSLDEKEDKDNNSHQMDDQSHHNLETQIAEHLAKAVASNSYLRQALQGISVGVTPNVRAAPALEACLECVWHGQKERREWSKSHVAENKRNRATKEEKNNLQNESGMAPAAIDVSQDITKSAVGIIAQHPDDLVGMDPERETDAVQGAIQSRVTAEWNGNGNYESFAVRGMKRWRTLCFEMDAVPEESLLLAEDFLVDGSNTTKGGKKKRKVKRINKKSGGRKGGNAEYNEEEEEKIPKYKSVQQADIESTAMVVVFLLCAAAYLWSKHKDAIVSFGLSHISFFGAKEMEQ